MTKYNEEFKIKLVTEYLYGHLGYKSLAKKYNMPSSTPLRNWVSSYKVQGMEGLKRRKTKQEYSVQFKLDAVQFMLETGASYQETAVQFHLNNPSLIVRWLKAFRIQGIEGLNTKPKGRPSMSKKTNKQKKKGEKKLTREEELERENELLRLENAYLKKLRAFREDPNAFHEKHKQKWHSNSKKKDSD
ncbi:transposase [Virgibacillus halophilus]|uniref:Transposase n=2 Tax=Tigheibacillus halophilus TaxID=361280 RepID=A0ABU5C7Y2_9BACI|nr:transposase [Virgibacillus halophilus]MDY0394389.1 transposase [Virgibacillus halophilus]MDY0395451.1 transposase [Virgibacillus halophilus]MDY0395592.1 transposase [Virgibacillus halophilus]